VDWDRARSGFAPSQALRGERLGCPARGRLELLDMAALQQLAAMDSPAGQNNKPADVGSGRCGAPGVIGSVQCDESLSRRRVYGLMAMR